jgi:dTDP-glucose 4,6-dehydratase
MQRLIITGGAGFIGSQFVRLAIEKKAQVLIIDSLSYAGDLKNLEEVSSLENFRFQQLDIREPEALVSCVKDFAPTAVINFAAESHVDNSISGPRVFIETNVLGTLNLLEACRSFYQTLTNEEKTKFRYLQVSTDEVFGELSEDGLFDETTAYDPHSPYSASKAGADHLVKAWHRTYGLPTIITNCSNNYGPRQYPEKLIPYMIQQALAGKTLPVYGNGLNVRDWIHVEDHSHGVWLALTKAEPGRNYGFGGNAERTNIGVVENICSILDKLRPRESGSYKEQIGFVTDRPGHDWRYAIDSRRAEKELGFQRKHTSFENGLLQTIQWYLDNTKWVEHILSKRR